jgi:hypothetical protein
LKDRWFCNFPASESLQKITPDPGLLRFAAIPSTSSQMQPKLTSLSFIGWRRKGWIIGL